MVHSPASSRIGRYLRESAPHLKPSAPPTVKVKPVITLAYALGVPGKEIAGRVARQLAFHVIDREVLLAIEEDTRLSERIISALDEGKRSALDSWIHGWFDFHHRVVDPKSFQHMVGRAIRGISILGSAVIVGRGGNFFLKGTDAFRVRLIAPQELRVRSVMEGIEGGRPLSGPRAREEIEKHAKERQRSVRKYFGAEIDDPNAYDAVFNLRRLDPDHGAEVIVGAYHKVVGS